MKHSAICTKILFGLSFAIAQVSTPTVYASGGGAGVRGGGHIVDVDGTPELLDFVDSAVCDRRTGAELIDSHPTIQKTLERLAELDWYFAREIQTEMEFLDYCFTGPLEYISPNDFGVTRPVARKKVRQIGVRKGPNVYVDNELYESFRHPTNPSKNAEYKEYRQSFFVIHEVMHSYLGMELDERKLKLRSMVNALSKVEKGEITTRKTLYFHMTKNGVDFPQNVERLNPYRKQVGYITASAESRRAQVMAEENPEILMTPDVSVFKQWLSPWDAKVVSSQVLVQEDVRSILLDGTFAEFKDILGVKKFEKIQPEVIALSLLMDLSPEKREYLLKLPSLSGVTERSFARIRSAKVAQGEFRILADSKFQKLAANASTPFERPLTELKRRKGAKEESALPDEVLALAQLTVYLLKNEAWAELGIMVTSNDSFYEAMNLTTQISDIEKMTPFVPYEKDLALSVIAQIRDGLKQSWLRSIESSVRPEVYAEFLKKLKLN